MSGFTPGPWWADASHYGTVYIEANAVIDKRLLQEICAVGPTESGREQQLANARLIAAAPELYERLKEARDAIASLPEYALGGEDILHPHDGEVLGHYPIRDELLSNIDAALSKAAGEGV